MRHGLSDATVIKIQKVLAAHPEVGRAVLYGSRALGTFRNGSDIDLALSGDSGIDFRILCRILDELDGLMLPYGMDVSAQQDISDPEVLSHISRVGVTFYERTSQ